MSRQSHPAPALKAKLATFFSPSALWQSSALRLADIVTPHSGYRRTKDIAYGPHPRQQLDFYAASQRRAGSPLIVFFYGGGWDSGEKGAYRFAAQAFAAEGYDVAIPDYRLYPQVRFPAFVEDAAEAVALLAERKDLGAGRDIVLMGHSAGAQIAMLLALDQRYLGSAGLAKEERVAAAIGLAGPYDFLPLKQERYRRVFPEESRGQSQPIRFAKAGSPPVFLAVGTGDRTVDPGNSSRLAARIRSEGGQVRLITYPGKGHAALVGSLLVPLRQGTPVLADILAFLEEIAARSFPNQPMSPQAAQAPATR
ncbi:alpha/beta hydrolase [Afifella sp. IM 167]|uniref:alpha/beta hydrolase n=1 Tax=Afifella sp. IM 167 TaxID=2033586 RepID=UPI001CCC2ECE|nr:alpha/beta hydrolase [Afifella sp. IM 167]MBZ8133316.1 hypothetical protein [Afifella sp. IM 167]